MRRHAQHTATLVRWALVLLIALLGSGGDGRGSTGVVRGAEGAFVPRASYDAGVPLPSHAAVHAAIHSPDHHAHAKRSATLAASAQRREFRTTAAHAGSGAKRAEAAAATPATHFSVHSLQLAAGALYVPSSMRRSFNTLEARPSHPADQAQLLDAWAAHHRATRQFTLAAPSQAQMPRAPHRVFDYEFFHEPQLRGGSSGGRAGKRSLAHHRPHMLRDVQLQPTLSQVQGEEQGSSLPPPSSLHLHVPSRQTLDTMRAYFRASGNETEAALSALYGARDGEEALATHPRFHYSWLLHLKSPVTAAVRERVEQSIAPYTLSEYVPHSGFIVTLPYHLALRLQEGAEGGTEEHPAGEGSTSGNNGEDGIATDVPPSSASSPLQQHSTSVLFISMLHPEFKVQRELAQHLETKMRAKESRAKLYKPKERSQPLDESSASTPKPAPTHELRILLSSPTFSPPATSSSRSSSFSSLTARFPSNRTDLSLTRAFARRQNRFWARFLQREQREELGWERGQREQQRGPSSSSDGDGDEYLEEESATAAVRPAIHFQAVDSQQLLVRLSPSLLPHSSSGDSDDEGAESDSFLSFFLRRLSRNPRVSHIAASSVHQPLNMHARLLVQSSDALGEAVRCAGAQKKQVRNDGGGGNGGFDANGEEDEEEDEFGATPYHVARSPTATAQSPFSSLLHLDGSGALLTIGDTGVDFDSCFFHDAAHPVPVNPTSAAESKHRKIASYVTARVSDSPNAPRAAPGDWEGHGTHTAGSLAGSLSPTSSFSPGQRVDNYTFSELSQWGGVAPQARLAIWDFQNPGDSALYLPNDIAGEFLAPSYAMGSRISSNSWGDESGLYDSYARDVDAFLWEKDDYLMVMAAGNSGQNGGHTLATPAVAKNLLTVGASMNDACSFFERGEASGVQVLEPPEVRGEFGVTAASFGGSFTLFRPEPLPEELERGYTQVCYASPPTACIPLLNAAECAGKVVLVERLPPDPKCTFNVKAMHVQQAGGIAMALLLQNDPSIGVFIMDPDADWSKRYPDVTISIPLVTLELDLTNKLRPHLAPSARFPRGIADSMRLLMPVYHASPLQSAQALSDFSSKGPTLDGRIKPDVMAPGHWIVSALSDDNLNSFQCAGAMEPPRPGAFPGAAAAGGRKVNRAAALKAMEGTSMACPIAAGTAALVRQYFTDGHYVSPSTGLSVPMESPSSALLKAVLVSGTSPLGGTTPQGGRNKDRIPVEPPPSYHQGHGRVELGETLAYDLPSAATTKGAGGERAGGSDERQRSKYRLWVKDQVEISTGEVHAYCFRIRANTSAAAAAAASPSADPLQLKASLVWTDPPPSMTSALLLVNNLDLIVVGYNVSVAGESSSSSSATPHRVYIGNARLNPPPSPSSSGTAAPQLHFDTSNNVEKVVVPSPLRGGLYNVVVRGTHVPVPGPTTGSRGQKYALVVNGDFDVSELCPMEVYCPNDCSGNGQCVVVSGGEGGDGAAPSHVLAPNTGLCRCDPHWAGAACDVAAQPILPDGDSKSSAQLTVPMIPDAWSFLYYDVRPGDVAVTWSFTRLSGEGDPDFYLTYPPLPGQMQTFPTLSFFNQSNTECDSCPQWSQRPPDKRVHKMVVDGPDLYPGDATHKGGGTIMLGVWGYCCDQAQVQVKIQVQRV